MCLENPPLYSFPPITDPCLAPRGPSPTGGMAPGLSSPTFHCVNLRPPTRRREPLSLYHCGHFLGFSLVSVWFYVCNEKNEDRAFFGKKCRGPPKKFTKAIHLRTRIHLNAHQKQTPSLLTLVFAVSFRLAVPSARENNPGLNISRL